MGSSGIVAQAADGYRWLRCVYHRLQPTNHFVVLRLKKTARKLFKKLVLRWKFEQPSVSPVLSRATVTNAKTANQPREFCLPA